MRQIRLYDDEEKLRPVAIRLGDLPPDDQLVGPDPMPALVRIIADRGMQTAINLVVTPDNQTIVTGGSRRIKALRRAGYDDDYIVYAFVRHGLGPEELLDELALNNTASRNYHVEALNIQELARLMSPKAIAKSSGMSLNDVEQIIAITLLPVDLYAAFLDDAMAVGTAKLATKCEPDEWRALEEILSDKGKLTLKDVQGVRRKTASSIDMNQLGLLGDEEGDNAVTWSAIQEGNVVRLRNSAGETFVLDLDDLREG